MRVTVETPQIRQLAEAYGITRQRIHQLRQRDGLPIETIADPDRLFSYLLDIGRAGKLRGKLADSSTRETIKKLLQ